MTDICIFGATSILGYQLWQRWDDSVGVTNRHNRHRRCRGLLRADMESSSDIAAVLAQLQPQVVIHAGGICDVDRCEADPAWAWDINVRGTARLCAQLPAGTRLVYCSSDHVFGGEQGGPYDEYHLPAPISVYGRSRVAAEAVVRAYRPDALIVRLGLVLGASIDGRRGHLDWLRHRHRRGLPLTVVEDEWRHAVSGAAVADRLRELMAHDVRGIVHVTAPQAVNRLQLAQHFLRQFHLSDCLSSERRQQQTVPHLGRVDLATRHSAAWAAPLPSVFSDLSVAEDPFVSARAAATCGEQ